MGKPGNSPYMVTLATVEADTPYTATVVIYAESREAAEEAALESDFDDLEWTDDMGNETIWDDIDCPRSGVVIAAE